MINTNDDRSIVTGEMTVVYAKEAPPTQYEKSIFLAGPTPRSNDVESWRPQALSILRDWGYDGVVFVPEDRPDEYGVTRFHGDYDAQVEWETRYLHIADCILFWIPRNLVTLPAFTTNVEWGVWQRSGKVAFGSPSWAVKNRYLELQAESLVIKTHRTLADVVRGAMDFVGDGALRSDGEREIPLYIWQTPTFQQWYAAQRTAGNSLTHAKVEWTYRVGPDRQYVLFWALETMMYVAKENRYKSEVIISRPDISAIIAYRRGETFNQTEIVLVREFRCPASNPTGYVWELPGGSSFKPGITAAELAAEKWHEEVGFQVAEERFVYHESRQLGATVSARQARLFALELTAEEMERLKENRGVAHGVTADSEQAFVEVHTLAEIRSRNYVDWSMLGMIMQVLVP